MWCGSLVALVTPFKKNGKVDERALYELVKWHKEAGTNAIVCVGTTGESPTLSEEETVNVIRICVEAAEKKIPVIAGTGSNCTRKSVALTEKAVELGCSGCLIIVPYYNRPDQRGCMAHFKKIADTGAKLIIYHHPKRTGVTLQLKTISSLLKHPHIVAVKEASSDLAFSEKVISLNQKAVFSGDDLLTLEMMSQGAKGVISVAANCIPEEFALLTQHLLEKKEEEALEVFERIKPFCEALSLEINPQCIKYALFLMGKISPYMRLPLMQPREKTKKALRESLEKLGLL